MCKLYLHEKFKNKFLLVIFMCQIYEWNEISDEFTDGLILGNGSSIAIDNRFWYKSLLEEARNQELIGSDVSQIFEHLKTSDFELVLRMLWHSSKINEYLDIQDQRSIEAYKSVREALIKVVREHHVEPNINGLDEKLNKASSFMKKFQTVISLNYDLLVYWSIIKSNDFEKNKSEANDRHKFKDCFVENGSNFSDNWSKLRKPLNGYKETTIVAYPHGNLTLATKIDGTESKISRLSDKDNLLESIFQKWNKGELIPLFVSEGTKEQKLSSIRRSHYLSTVYDEIIPDIQESVVFFGWSIGKNDFHILDSLCKSGIKKFAFSVNNQLSEDVLKEEYYTRLNRLNEFSEKHKDKHQVLGKTVELKLFNRASAGCWIT
jgi:hypothetical protein